MTEPGSFETFYSDVFPRLAALGAMRTGSVDSGKDLAQETLARAHARWEAVEDYDHPEAWCRAVLVNLAIDQHRRKATERRGLEALRREHAEPSDTAPALSEWNALVDQLPPAQRDAVSLFYGLDLSLADTAAALGITKTAAKARLFKARRTLERSLTRLS